MQNKKVAKRNNEKRRVSQYDVFLSHSSLDKK